MTTHPGYPLHQRITRATDALKGMGCCIKLIDNRWTASKEKAKTTS
jgi:hypothetical protein